MTRIISFVFALALMVNFAYARGNSPVEQATKNGDFELVKNMLESGTDPNAGSETPLYWAVRAKRLDLVKLLLKYHADINRTEDYGYEPLIAAMQFKANDIAEYIVKETNIGINNRVDYGGENTYLTHAIKNKNHKIMLMLLEKGASAVDNGSPYTRGVAVDRAEEARNKPLQDAANLGDPIAIRLLLEFGANPNAVNRGQGESLFGWMLMTTSDSKVVDAFIRKGLDVKKISQRGLSVLHYAVYAAIKGKNFNKDSIGILVKAGADLNAKNKDNLSPVIYAMTFPKSKERDEVVAYLKRM